MASGLNATVLPALPFLAHVLHSVVFLGIHTGVPLGQLSVAVWQGCEGGEQWAERRAAQSSHDLPFPSGQDVVAATSPTCVWPTLALTHMASLAFCHQILAQACGRATLLPMVCLSESEPSGHVHKTCLDSASTWGLPKGCWECGG